MTVQQREAKRIVRAWCAKRRREWTVVDIRHVHPLAHVVGYAAPLCLVVASPWLDSEPHMREWDRANPLDTIHEFDPELKAGDWCIKAYVSTVTCGMPVAVPWPSKERR